ncbi:hypothetical protein [Paludisphaera rhizosphaerae]|uniref:hypothetical protein n=1 Tax=Paludisphaera rhizosphaerae TaxID=2711216 RepID=UPI0013EA9BC0|nr:hypothetical protein [Paludisphaera rhizosphaerae]
MSAKERFCVLIEELVSRFEAGLQGTEWVTRRYPKRLRDDDRQLFEVPALYLQKGTIKLLLDPIGYDVPGAEAAADIYQMPGYDPTASLFFEDGRWTVDLTLPSSEEFPNPPEMSALPLNPTTINQVLDTIAEYAVPSF